MGARERLPVGQVDVHGAAEGGHLEVLQWLRANGCPWDRETIIRARAIRHFEMANWARANGCPEQK